MEEAGSQESLSRLSPAHLTRYSLDLAEPLWLTM